MKVEGFQMGGKHLNKPVSFVNVESCESKTLLRRRKRMIIINSKLTDEALLKAIYKAASEYSKLIGNSYLIIGKNINSDYFWFQCYFEKKHFMHWMMFLKSVVLNRFKKV